MQRPRIRILIGNAVAIGPGKAKLLTAISETGSISAAARKMGMSYRRAWGLVDQMNMDFIAPLVIKNTGGRGGGGATLSKLGVEVLTRYIHIENKAAKSVASDLDAFVPFLQNPVLFLLSHIQLTYHRAV